MKKLFKVKSAVIILLGFSLFAFGQSDRQVEQELVTHIKNIEQWSNYTNRSADEDLTEKLYKENEIFQEKLLKYTKRLSTLKYKFGELAEHISISTSEDEKFRIYSWDTETGGTMHFYRNVYQFRGKDDKAHSRIENLPETDPSGFVSDIFTLETKTGKVYLARFTSILSTPLSSQSISLFKIKKNSLDDNIKLVKTKTGIKNSLGFEYNFFSVYERPERPIKLILYDKAARSIKIPVVIQKTPEDYGTVTDKFITYKFNGKYFVKVS